MTIRIDEETILLVVLIISAFALAIGCLACSLNGREPLDCSLFRCCCQRRNQSEDEEPQTYATLNEFIFESEDEQRVGFVAMNDEPTTMEQVFPDLLGGDEESNNNSSSSNGNAPTSKTSHHTELSEPLL